MKDELKKLGLKIRPRTTEPASRQPGQIAFDDRGNAVYEWSDRQLMQDGDDADRARSRALEYAGMTLVEDEQPASAPIRSNPRGTRLGYDPYESGLLTKQPRRKLDLRELSRWVETRRKLAKRAAED